MKRFACLMSLFFAVAGCAAAKMPSGTQGTGANSLFVPGGSTEGGGDAAGGSSFGSGAGFTQDSHSTDGDSESSDKGNAPSAPGTVSDSPNTLIGSAMPNTPKGCHRGKGSDKNDQEDPIVLALQDLKATYVGKLEGTDNIIVQVDGAVEPLGYGSIEADVAVHVSLDRGFQEDPDWRIGLDWNHHFGATIRYPAMTTFYWKVDQCSGTSECWQLTIKDKSAEMQFTTCPVAANPIAPPHPKTPPDEDPPLDRPPNRGKPPHDDHRPFHKGSNDDLR